MIIKTTFRSRYNFNDVINARVDETIQGNQFHRLMNDRVFETHFSPLELVEGRTYVIIVVAGAVAGQIDELERAKTDRSVSCYIIILRINNICGQLLNQMGRRESWQNVGNHPSKLTLETQLAKKELALDPEADDPRIEIQLDLPVVISIVHTS